MTDRPTASTINDQQLDELHERAEQAEAEVKRWLAFIERGMNTHMQFGVINPDGSTKQLPCADWCYACRVEKAEAAIARVRQLRDAWLLMTLEPGQVRRLLDGITAALDQPTPGPAVTQATEAARDEAIRQLDADPHGLNTGMIVKPYTDHGLQRWVFRCWGTDTCDGWLSLDHTSQQSAERARDRHVHEEHTSEERH